jgi:signal transduction histidine kinase
VRLAQQEQDLAIEVGDDGVGFDPEKSLALAGHYGLLGMCERAQLAGGDLAIHSAPGQGAVLRLSLPLQADAHLPVAEAASELR